MNPFALHRPTDLEEACRLLRELGEAATVYCGGTELIQVMKMGLAAYDHLIDLKRIDALRAIDEAEDGTLIIGAAVTHREIEHSPIVARRWPDLAALEAQVANVRVRNSGSLGGNLCFAEPHSDPATLLIAADASVQLRGANGARKMALDEFLIGALETARQPDEILVAVSIPAAPASDFFAYRRIAFKERPVASVAARVGVADGAIASTVLAVGSVGDRPIRIPGVDELLAGSDAATAGAAVEAAAELAAASCDAASEPEVSEEYQRYLVSVLARKALDAALGQAWAAR